MLFIYIVSSSCMMLRWIDDAVQYEQLTVFLLDDYSNVSVGMDRHRGYIDHCCQSVVYLEMELCEV